jgi:hypothetical protein
MRSGNDRLGQDKSGDVRLGQDISCYVRLYEVVSGQARLSQDGQVRPYWVRLCHVGTGYTMLGQVRLG